MERRIDTLCSFCRGHAEIGPHESYLPLCRDCRERLFGAPRDGSPDGLRKELTRLRKASKFSLLLTAFLLYDNRQLQRQLPPGEELDKLVEEAQEICCFVGRSVFPGLFHQLAIYFFQAGWHEDAINLLDEVTEDLYWGHLLYGQAEERCQHHLSECFIQQAKIYGSLGDTARQVWALSQAENHLRAQIKFCVRQYEAVQNGLRGRELP